MLRIRPAASPRRPGESIRCDFPTDRACGSTRASMQGAEVPIYYDPMISKLAVWGRDRAEAIERMRRALADSIIAGELTTNLDFHRWIINHPRFIAGDFDTGLHRTGVQTGCAGGRGRQCQAGGDLRGGRSRAAGNQPSRCAGHAGRIARRARQCECVEDARPSRCVEAMTVWGELADETALLRRVALTRRAAC